MEIIAIIIAVAAAVIIAVAALVALLWQRDVAYREMKAMIPELSAEIRSLKAENREHVENQQKLMDKMNELKTMVAMLITELSGIDSEELQRILAIMKVRISDGNIALNMISQGRVKEALSLILEHIEEEFRNEVVALLGNLNGLNESLGKKLIDQDHYERELARIRLAAIRLAKE